jgi:hypothetical protein
MTSFISDDVKMETYPDPQNGILKIITLYDLGDSADLKIFSSTGRIVIHKELNRNILEVKVETLSRGIYYGILKNSYFTERFKFYKK